MDVALMAVHEFFLSSAVFVPSSNDMNLRLTADDYLGSFKVPI